MSKHSTTPAAKGTHMKKYRNIKVDRAVIGNHTSSMIQLCIVGKETSDYIHYIATSQWKLKDDIEMLLEMFQASVVDGIVVVTQAQIDQHAAGDLLNLGWFLTNSFERAGA